MDTVKTISAQVERLPLRLQEEVLHFVRHLVLRNRIEADRKADRKKLDSNTVQPRRSIMELRGLGKKLWKDTSVKEYINAERDAWDG